MKKIAVILSGCGFLDGAEIREAVLTLLYLDEADADVKIFAPNIDQHHVVNHLTQEESTETRNVLAESARIARGKITPLKELHAVEFDALVVPGGFGVAKNLSDFAFKGAEATLFAEFSAILEDFKVTKKPIGLICIAPAVAAAILKDITVTIGDDKTTAEVIAKMGSTHQEFASDEICVDEENKIVSTSAYMRDDKISNIAVGIKNLVNKVLELA